ncbi:hypothetical protein CHLRE_02g088850v5 [Chlamydomonas reinhardtii]|uniref:6,7-dimethyl-8-ribityllumazine synthase n=1 Tax=Chlamydomonas reinhardtii TaxID=3055 RepID=A8I8Z1_CHLRE|nr:uncharacterized protein CHLRE_02g088850v5 [Chlamydomonas reinhardtii]PNW86495.1 hypothetical protein CHLRE_02g088850v5 [Chlamydomonas reinhardtii]|eukprot:XP_001701760.1 6,7-dimethyl-8-ribityllumazine synthase [Chlamydomonas reinhardtii]
MAALQSRVGRCVGASARRQHSLVASRVAVPRPSVSVVPQVQQEAHHVQGVAQIPSSRASCIARATYHGSVMAEPGSKYAVVVARFNSLITKGLLEGAMETFEAHGVPKENVDVAWVPGSFEMPVIAKSMAKSGKYAGVVCIGAVIRGATTHYDAVVSAATSGVLNCSVDTGVPVVFGVLTTDDLEQALDRTGGKVGNKGGEAALTAVETATLLAKLKKEGKASW